MNNILNQIDSVFGTIVGYIAYVLFFPIFEFPLIVIILLIGALTFTFYFRFINIRGFMHSIDIIKGKPTILLPPITVALIPLTSIL